MVDNNKEHCCDMMRSCIDDPGIALAYSGATRTYYIPLLYRHQVSAWQLLFVCPWCGDKLPTNLQEEYDRILSEEYGIEWEHIVTKEKEVPEEFKIDTWWKNRGL